MSRGAWTWFENVCNYGANTTHMISLKSSRSMNRGAWTWFENVCSYGANATHLVSLESFSMSKGCKDLV
jgi:hypothetical protein